MLSPAVRAAAAQFAAEPLGTLTPAQGRELAFLNGYTLGYTTRPERVDFPLAGQRELHRLFGAYLGEGIDVYHPFSNRYGKLKGLPFREWHEAGPVADVEFYADAEARAEGGGDLTEPESRIVPVLYAFEDLAAELLLPDGRRGVPAVEVAKVQWPHRNTVKATWHKPEELHLWEDSAEFNDNEKGGLGRFMYLYEADLQHRLTFSWAAAALLRSLHFAVGLAPHQYHRRVVGFDYASGGRPGAEQPTWLERRHWSPEAIMGREQAPCAQNCAGCQTGKEVCGG